MVFIEVFVIGIGKLAREHLEKLVVELDDLGVAPKILVEMLDSFVGIVERVVFFAELYKLFCLSATPAVDGLFWVAYDHERASFAFKVFAGKGVVDEGNEVLPLHFGGILKLVYKKVLVFFAQPFVDEGRGLVLDFFVDDGVEL
ncbi:hypothetical protein D3C72_874470 [compost metagenome]